MVLILPRLWQQPLPIKDMFKLGLKFIFAGLVFLVSSLGITALGADVNVSGGVVCASNNCAKDIPPVSEVHVTGCMDSEADNYNAAADISGPCVYTVPTISNLSASYDPSSKKVRVTWTNPRYSRRQYIRVVRSTSSVTSPESGSVVYQGSGSSFEDSSVSTGIKYYYTAFVRDTGDNWSSAVVTSITPVKGGEPPVEPPTEPLVIPSGGGGSSGGSIDVFSFFPSVSSGNPLIRSLSLSSFVIRQPGLADKSFGTGRAVRIDGKRNMTIFLPYAATPEVLKTIGVAVTDPDNPRQAISFLMTLRKDGTGYEATIGPILKAGNYPINIYFINFQDQTIKKMSGRLLVTGNIISPVVPIVTSAIKNVVTPVSIGTGITVGFLQVIFNVARVDSIYDLWLAILRLFGLLLGYLGFRRRPEPWGVVYDAVTKQPIDPAYVSVEVNPEKEFTSAITDIDGRYGFYLPPGTYRLKAGKTHYVFPSQTMAGRDQDEIYDNLYFGEEFNMGEGEVVRKNIPLDPVGFDWNEFIKSKVNFFRVHSRKELLRHRILNGFYIAGFVFAVGSFFYRPNWIDMATIVLFVFLGLFNLWTKKNFKVWQLKNSSGEPLSFAVLKLFLPDIDQLVKTVVADAYGRVYVLTSPGKYYFTVDEKQPDGTYRTTYRSEVVYLKKGVLTGDITLPDTSPIVSVGQSSVNLSNL